MTTVTLHEGDNRDHLRRLIDQGVRVHSVVTDPPYGLTSVVKRFGKEGAAPAKFGTDGAFARASGGFMGKAWDASGIERDPEFWRLIWEILLPGGFVFAFSGSRTGHWQACAMEMAGFIMHPMHGWVYGSGMPKAHNPCPAIDKQMGVESEVVGTAAGMGKQNPEWNGTAQGRTENSFKPEYEVRRPVSPEAQKWDGWRYGTQTQKPALEPIYLGQKPYSEKTGHANLLKHGVGALNIDGCRVPHVTVNGGNLADNPHLRESINGGNGGHIFPAETERRVVVPNAEGRWPANLLHDGSAEVVALFPANAGASAPVKGTEESISGIHGTYNPRNRVAGAFHADSGSASRFFNSFPDGPDADAIIYHAKASKADREGSKHPTVKAIGLMEHLIRHITPPGGVVLDPFAGSGTTAAAARRLGFDCILMEQDADYAAFLRKRFALVEDDLADLLS